MLINCTIPIFLHKPRDILGNSKLSVNLYNHFFEIMLQSQNIQRFITSLIEVWLYSFTKVLTCNYFFIVISTLNLNYRNEYHKTNFLCVIQYQMLSKRQKECCNHNYNHPTVIFSVKWISAWVVAWFCLNPNWKWTCKTC